MARPSLKVVNATGTDRATLPGEVRGDEVQLYEAHKKIYPRAVHGWFAAWRWTLV
jgi:hypothetical protein